MRSQLSILIAKIRLYRDLKIKIWGHFGKNWRFLKENFVSRSAVVYSTGCLSTQIIKTKATYSFIFDRKKSNYSFPKLSPYKCIKWSTYDEYKILQCVKTLWSEAEKADDDSMETKDLLKESAPVLSKKDHNLIISTSKNIFAQLHFAQPCILLMLQRTSQKSVAKKWHWAKTKQDAWCYIWSEFSAMETEIRSFWIGNKTR